MDREEAGDGEKDGEGRDPMGPPEEACECYCLHCGRVFMSDQMWFQRVINARDGFEGFWMCPTANCSGAGFCFDIFPTDPEHPANGGWEYCDDEEWEEEDGEWDAEEAKYKEMDEEGEEDDDIEGEEWKYEGRGEREESEESKRMREQWEAEQRRYDEPDERPRVLDWKNEERPGGIGRDEDIPF